MGIDSRPTMLDEQVALQSARMANGPGMRQGPGTNMSRSNASGDVMLQQTMEVKMVRVTGASSTYVPPFVQDVTVSSRLYAADGTVMPEVGASILWSPVPVSIGSYVWAVFNGGHYELVANIGTAV